jgi:predicted adenine nucleotide alpha hydrolase (AANH) superfamily ATPase
MEGEYDSKKYYDTIKGYENDAEGGERCFKCYELRLREAAQVAKEHNFDYFTTTLSISPMKNAQKLNEIGGRLESELGVQHLYSDFKKKNGYKRSIELSKDYHLYRQDYCGCVFSMRSNSEESEQREAKIIEKSE